MPLNPTVAGSHTEIPARGIIAMAVNGVPAYGPQEAGSTNAVEPEAGASITDAQVSNIYVYIYLFTTCTFCCMMHERLTCQCTSIIIFVCIYSFGMGMQHKTMIGMYTIHTLGQRVLLTVICLVMH